MEASPNQLTCESLLLLLEHQLRLNARVSGEIGWIGGGLVGLLAVKQDIAVVSEKQLFLLLKLLLLQLRELLILGLIEGMMELVHSGLCDWGLIGCVMKCHTPRQCSPP